MPGPGPRGAERCRQGLHGQHCAEGQRGACRGADGRCMARSGSDLVVAGLAGLRGLVVTSESRLLSACWCFLETIRTRTPRLGHRRVCTSPRGLGLETLGRPGDIQRSTKVAGSVQGGQAPNSPRQFPAKAAKAGPSPRAPVRSLRAARVWPGQGAGAALFQGQVPGGGDACDAAEPGVCTAGAGVRACSSCWTMPWLSRKAGQGCSVRGLRTVHVGVGERCTGRSCGQSTGLGSRRTGPVG